MLNKQKEKSYQASQVSGSSKPGLNLQKVKLKPSYMDPQAGLLHIQGSAFLHLAMSITMFFIDVKKTNPEYTLQCNETITQYNQLVTLMYSVHVLCFLFMVSQLIAHYHNREGVYGAIKRLSLLMIPLYQGSILYLVDVNNQETQCQPELGNMIHWIDMEILTFFIYIALIPWILLKSRFTRIGILQNPMVSEQQIGKLMEKICLAIFEEKKCNPCDTICSTKFDFQKLVGNDLIPITIEKNYPINIDIDYCFSSSQPEG